MSKSRINDAEDLPNTCLYVKTELYVFYIGITHSQYIMEIFYALECLKNNNDFDRSILRINLSKFSIYC